MTRGYVSMELLFIFLRDMDQARLAQGRNRMEFKRIPSKQQFSRKEASLVTVEGIMGWFPDASTKVTELRGKVSASFCAF